MSSSCAWYKLFEIRRLIFHIGNPRVSNLVQKKKNPPSSIFRGSGPETTKPQIITSEGVHNIRWTSYGNLLPVYGKQYPPVTVETRVNIESHHKLCGKWNSGNLYVTPIWDTKCYFKGAYFSVSVCWNQAILVQHTISYWKAHTLGATLSLLSCGTIYAKDLLLAMHAGDSAFQSTKQWSYIS